MARAAAKTGGEPTALVAVEQCFPKNERIIVDDLAYRIMPSGKGQGMNPERVAGFSKRIRLEGN